MAILMYKTESSQGVYREQRLLHSAMRVGKNTKRRTQNLTFLTRLVSFNIKKKLSLDR